MSISNYLELQLLDAVFNAEATGLPIADVYVKLHIGDPGEAGTGNAAGETTRKIVTFGASVAGVSTSDADVTWTNVSTTETYSHISLWDHLTAGNHLWYGALTTPKAVNSGDTFTIASTALSASLD